MKSRTTALDEPNKIKLTVEVSEDDLADPIEKAFKKIAGQVNLPGFRRGKAPRKLLEQQIGTEAARAQAIQDSLSEFYLKALDEEEIDAIAPPKVEITEGEKEGNLVFEAEVETRPVANIDGYKDIELTISSPKCTDEDVEESLKKIQEMRAETETVERAAKMGDIITIDVETKRVSDGERVPGMNTDDFTYEVGSKMLSFGDDFDVKMEGLSAGDELEFKGKIPPENTEVEFEVNVKEVKEKKFPELTDEWIKENTGIESLEELKKQLRDSLVNTKRDTASHEAVERASESLSEFVTVDLPETLVTDEMERQQRALATRVRQQGMDPDQFFAMMSQNDEGFMEKIKEKAEAAVRVDLALRALVKAESIEVSEVEIDEEIEMLAKQFNQKAKRIRRDLEKIDQLDAIKDDVAKKKAIRWLLENCSIKDNDGNQVDVKDLDLEDHDHSH